MPPQALCIQYVRLSVPLSVRSQQTRPQGGRVHYTHAAAEALNGRGRSLALLFKGNFSSPEHTCPVLLFSYLLTPLEWLIFLVNVKTEFIDTLTAKSH